MPGGERSRRSAAGAAAGSGSREQRRRADALRRTASARRRAADDDEDDTDSGDGSEAGGYAQSISEASERVMHSLGAAQAAFCQAPALPALPQMQMPPLPALAPLPSPAALYDKFSTQARLRAGAARAQRAGESTRLSQTRNAAQSARFRLTQPLPRALRVRQANALYVDATENLSRALHVASPAGCAPLCALCVVWRSADERFPFSLSRSGSVAPTRTERAPLPLRRRPGGATHRRRHARCATLPRCRSHAHTHTHTRTHANARTKHACVRSHTAHARARLFPGAQPRAAAAASTEAPLPPVVAMRFPPGSLRVARGVSEDDDEDGPPAARAPLGASPLRAKAPPEDGDASRSRSDSASGSGGGGRRRRRSRGRRRHDDDDDAGGGRGLRRQRSRGRQQQQQRSRAGGTPASSPRFNAAGGGGGGGYANSEGGAAALRGLAAGMRARSLAQSGSVRASTRSPHAQALKRHLADARGVAASALLDLFSLALASLLSLFVPMQNAHLCPSTSASSAATSAALCSFTEQLAFGRFTPLHKAVFVLNWGTLLIGLLAECIFLWRELWLIEHCDEDRAAPWAALSAQLGAYPSLAQSLDRVNTAAVRAASILAAALAVNFAASAALAAAQWAGYRTAVTLIAFCVPAVRRVVAFRAAAVESADKRIALPLWAGGFVSLNCLDEACTRTGEDGGV